VPYFKKKNYNIDLMLTGKSLPSIFRKNNIIFKKNLKKDILNYYIKKSFFVILPLQESPGTKIKVIENLIFGKTIIGTKFAFKGIKINENFKNIIIYKSFYDLCKKINFFIKNNKIYIQKKSAIKKFYIKNYSIKNIIKKFIYENKINFI
jgi:glycosyltransferase involved in cell wall biosynthesis